MGYSHGPRRGTRKLMSKKREDKGAHRLSSDMQQYRRGDYVDIVINSAFQKGMPYKVYHGRTGIVYKVGRRAIGVVVYKVCGNSQLEKRVAVRTEHVRPSRCREAKQKMDEFHAQHGKDSVFPGLKPKEPRPAEVVDLVKNEPILVRALPYSQAC